MWRRRKSLETFTWRNSKKTGKGSGVTSRQVYSYGLIAGLTYTEMREMLPGFILDAFVRRLKYDTQLQTLGLTGKVGAIFGGHK